MKNAKKIKLNNTEFPIVTKLNGLDVGRIYRTTEYGILTPLSYNRGVKTGIVTSKLATIRQLILDGLFYMNVIHVEINLKGQIIDGHHRFTELKSMGLPVNFIINSQPEFNCDDPSEILNNVSEYNSVNSSWSDTDAYLSALGFNEPAAVAIFNLKQYVAQKGIDSSIFTPARVVALATKFKGGLAGRKQKRSVYCDKNIADTINSDEFYSQIDLLMELFKSLDNNATPFFYVRSIMPIVWEGFLTLEMIVNAIINDRFTPDTEKMRDVKDYIDAVVRKKFWKRFK